MTDPPELHVPKLVWPKTVEDIESRVKKIIDDSTATWDQIGQLKGDLMYENVVEPLVCISNYKTNPMVCEAKFLQHCSPNPELRTAASKAGATFKKLRRTGRMRMDVYKIVSKYEQQSTEKLTRSQRHFLTKILRDFSKCGLHLNPSQRTDLESIMSQESGLCRRYTAAVGEDKTILLLTAEQLSGLPQDWLDARSDKKGKYRISLKYLDIMMVMSKCIVGETRRLVSGARDTACGGNLDLLVNIMSLRQQFASLLGFSCYADYVCQGSMVGDASSATSFLLELTEKLRPAAEVEYERLLRYKRSHMSDLNIPFDGVLHPWDITFYTERLTEREYGIDEELIRQHFPLDHVLSTTMTLYEGILGLRITEVPNDKFNSWHECVRLFSVTDAADSRPLGHFYLDLHPRPGKYPHAAIFFITKKYKEQCPVACMLANLQGLLRHKDVITFFHELGHALHGICAEGDANMTRLAKCSRDWMEAPSQMMENWCWDTEVLKEMSQHHKTKVPLSDRLIAQLLKTRYVNAAINTLNNGYLALLDLSLHTTPPTTAEDTQNLVDEMRPRVTLLNNPPGWNMLRNFCHVVAAYPSAYYSYLWSEVLSADMFHTRFATEGTGNPSTGAEYRKLILAPGGIGSAQESVHSFLKRDPNQIHFLNARTSALQINGWRSAGS